MAREDDVQRLARRAGAGDLESARRLASMLEARVGAPRASRRPRESRVFSGLSSKLSEGVVKRLESIGSSTSEDELHPALVTAGGRVLDDLIPGWGSGSDEVADFFTDVLNEVAADVLDSRGLDDPDDPDLAKVDADVDAAATAALASFAGRSRLPQLVEDPVKRARDLVRAIRQDWNWLVIASSDSRADVYVVGIEIDGEVVIGFGAARPPADHPSSAWPRARFGQRGWARRWVETVDRAHSVRLPAAVARRWARAGR